MNNQTGKMLTTSWNLVRDAGSAVSDAAVNADVGGKLMRTLPKVKELVSAGAGLALARRGGRVAVAVVKRNPVIAIAGAVALAGVGLAVAVAKRRKAAAENGDATGVRPRRIVAKNVRGSSRTVVAKPAAKAPAKTPARPRKARTTVSKTTS
jgi:hypothetical protein